MVLTKRQTYFLIVGLLLLTIVACTSQSRTHISLYDGRWLINGEVTYQGAPVEGLLLNVRMVNSTFEDATKPEFNIDGNTDKFVARIPEYVAAGVRAFTLNLQGGMPGYEGAVNSAFSPDGSLRQSYLDRIERVVKACDRAGAAVILGCFYQRQDQVLEDEAAVRTGVVNAARWIRERNLTNVLLEIANEYGHRGFDHEIISTPDGMAELIRLARTENANLLVSASGLGNGRIDSLVAEAADFILIHFNSTPVEDIPLRVNALKKYNKAIVCNEDDKVGAEAVRALKAAVWAGCSWGYMNNDVNQYVPFEFNGVEDDPVLYRAMKGLTSFQPVNSRAQSEKDNSILKND